MKHQLKHNIYEERMGMPSPMEYYEDISTIKKKVKFIMRVERICRSSMEYKDYIHFLKEYVDMDKCAFFNKVENKSGNRVRIEIHHEPLGLYDIVWTVLEKYLKEGIPVNDLYIADEVMEIHYKNMVGLVPLSKSMHQIVEEGNNGVFVPLHMVYGDYKKFVEEYIDYIPDKVLEKLEFKVERTKNYNSQSFDPLKPKYIYYTVDGIQLPKRVEVENESVA